MKNKRLLVCLIVFIVVGGLAVLGGTVFLIKDINKDIEIVFSNDREYLVGADYDDAMRNMKDAVSFLKGKNALFDLDREKISNDIETKEPRVRWTNTEAKFPNKVVITVRERYPVFYYSVNSSTDIVMDAKLRIVTIGLPEDRKGPNPEKGPLINITKEFNASFTGPDYSKYIKSDFSECLTDEEDIVRNKVLVDMMEYFEGGGYPEDHTRTFANVEFETMNIRHELDLIIKVDNITRLVIWDVKSDDFAEKLTIIWDVLGDCEQFPGEYIIFYSDIYDELLVVGPEGYNG